MTNLTPGVQHAMQCDSHSTDGCAGHGAGHGLLTLHKRVIAATPSKWRDAIVLSSSADGWIAVALFSTGETVWVWNHVDHTATAPVGTPVALHAAYHALAIGSEHLNVLVAGPVD
jgi:hypothetical protein